MADKFLNLTGLQHYHGKVETIFAGSMEIVGKTVTLKSKSGAVLSTITLPSQVYELATGSRDGLMSSAHYTKLEGISVGATKVENSSVNGNIKIDGAETPVYAHPTSTAGALAVGLYKLSTNADGHVISGTKVVKSDITALGIPAQDTTYKPVTVNANGLMTSELYSKLDGIEASAQVNKIESVSVDGKALVIAGKAVNIDLSPYALKSQVASAVRYKGSVATYSNLPQASAVETSDMYNVEQASPAAGIDAGTNVVWNGKSWDPMAPMFVIEALSTTEIDTVF